MHAQPNMAPIKTNIRDTAFIIRLSLLRRTTPVPKSTVNAENTNGRGPRGFLRMFFLYYLSSSYLTSTKFLFSSILFVF